MNIREEWEKFEEKNLAINASLSKNLEHFGTMGKNTFFGERVVRYE